MSLKIIHEVDLPKKATLVYYEEKDLYNLVHYDTIILSVKNNKVTKALKCSKTSTKAIFKVLYYLGINEDDIKLTPFTNFKKYEYGGNN
jgi:hypothetical protein